MSLIPTYSWELINEALDSLVLTLKKGYNIEGCDMIYSLGRGGMVPTRLLSGKLNIRNVGFIPTNRPLTEELEQHAIICDDIYDTGQTYMRLMARRGFDPWMKIFAFFFIRGKQIEYRPNNVAYGRIIEDNCYVVFPWEESRFD